MYSYALVVTPIFGDVLVSKALRPTKRLLKSAEALTIHDEFVKVVMSERYLWRNGRSGDKRWKREVHICEILGLVVEVGRCSALRRRENKR
jgi:hypothetical protein